MQRFPDALAAAEISSDMRDKAQGCAKLFWGPGLRGPLPIGEVVVD